MKFKFLKHTADIKFQSYGKTLSQAFENAVLATATAMYSKPVKKKSKEKIKISGKDLESLLYNFLEEILFLLDSKNFFPAKAKVKINQKDLQLEAEFEGDNANNYNIGLDVKAITYNEMFVKKIKNQWVCQVVLDV